MISISRITEEHVGRKFEAHVNGHKAKGKIQRHAGSYYLCQNTVRGMACPDLLGYEHSWAVAEGTPRDLENNAVYKLKVEDEWNEDENDD